MTSARLLTMANLAAAEWILSSLLLRCDTGLDKYENGALRLLLTDLRRLIASTRKDYLCRENTSTQTTTSRTAA